jgi:DNA invertase Pin-like site-specific DNA recombinase
VQVHKSGIPHKIQAAGIAMSFLCRFSVHNPGMMYGYARVSTDGQSVDAQVRQLAGAGCVRVFRETARGAGPGRAQLGRAQLGRAQLGRAQLGRAQLGRAQLGRAQLGRARARARGVKLGRKPRLTKPRLTKPRLTPHQQKEALARRERGEETLAEIGRSYNVSGWTIGRLGRAA